MGAKELMKKYAICSTACPARTHLSHHHPTDTAVGQLQTRITQTRKQGGKKSEKKKWRVGRRESANTDQIYSRSS